MNTKLVYASVLLAAALATAIFSATTTAVYADESETDTEQKIKQKNVGGEGSSQFDCAEGGIDEEGSALGVDVDLCGTADISVLEEPIVCP